VSQLAGAREAVEDRELLRQVALGSADALGRLYDQHASAVFGLARRILGQEEDAEEVVQDVFSQVWRQAARYQSERASVSGWLVMLTRTRAIDRLRSRKSRPDMARGVSPDQAPPLVAGAPDPESAVASSDGARAVRQALVALPDAQRSMVELAYFDGLTHTEIAERTGVPLGTVKTRLRTAMFVLREALAAGVRAQ
jgi:RNA polymerase sigma-70 factor (ECF subfamily)